jgi:hypothetical protein
MHCELCVQIDAYANPQQVATYSAPDKMVFPGMYVCMVRRTHIPSANQKLSISVLMSTLSCWLFARLLTCFLCVRDWYALDMAAVDSFWQPTSLLTDWRTPNNTVFYTDPRYQLAPYVLCSVPRTNRLWQRAQT